MGRQIINVLHFNSIVGDVLTYMRIMGAKKLRRTEETPEGRLDNLLPGLGLFHFLWEILRIILATWWGGETVPGTLSFLRVRLGQTLVSMDGKKFNVGDDFLHMAVRVKLAEAFYRLHQVSALDATPEQLPLMTTTLIKNVTQSKDFDGSFLQAGLLYIEVRKEEGYIF